MKTTVSVVKCRDYDFPKVKKAVRKSIGLLGGVHSFIQSGDKVLIKVNALGPFKPEAAVTTHPAVVKAVIQMVKDVGGKPVVGDFAGFGGEKHTKEILGECGIAAVCAEEGARLIGFETEGFSKVNVNGKKIREMYMSTALLDADKVISLPKLKTHTETIFTGGVKNSFGFTPYKIRETAHASTLKEFAEYVADFYSVRKPDLLVMDAIVGMEGNGPARGETRDLGLVLASADGVAIDSIACEITGIKNVYTTTVAAERGLGEGKLDNIEVLGEKVGELKVDFASPVTLDSKIPRFIRYVLISVLTSKLVVDKNKCTKCMACVEYCPPNAISFRKFPEINSSKCILCFGCSFLCPENAITVKKNPIKTALMGIRKIIKL